MKLKVIYPGGGSICAGGNCPTIFLNEKGDYVIQGYKTDIENLDLPVGETVVLLPKDFLEGFITENI